MQDREGLQRDFLKVFNWDEGSSRVRQQVGVCSSDTGCWAKKFFQLKKDQVQSWPSSSGVPMVTLYSWFGFGHFTPNPTIHGNARIHFYPPLGIYFHSPVLISSCFFHFTTDLLWPFHRRLVKASLLFTGYHYSFSKKYLINGILMM